MGNIRHIARVLAKGGWKTYRYLVRRVLRERWTEQQRYDAWRAFYEPFETKQTMAGEGSGKSLPSFSVVFSGSVSEEEGRQLLKSQNYAGWEMLPPGKTLQELISMMKGEYLVCVQKDVTLPENALARLAGAVMAKGNGKALLFYADEDRMENGRRTSPFFKPEYSPDTLRSFFYMGGLLAVDKGLLPRLLYCLDRPVAEGGYLLALEAFFLLKREQVCHIPEILSHRDNCFFMEQPEALKEEKERLFQFYHTPVRAELEGDCKSYRMVYLLEREPLVSVIIPSKDNPGMMRTCLESLKNSTAYQNMEIIVIDNGSSRQNRRQYEKLSGEFQNLTYAYEPAEFNFAKMCNSGVAKAKGEYLLFVNDDIEFLAAGGAYDWMTRMLGQAMQPHTGAVGAKLLYPNTNRIQHIGLVNYESGAAHLFQKQEDDRPLLQGRNRLDYNYSFVTGACLLVSREKFEKVGGFEEKLAVTFNDVDLCIKLLKQGYYNVVRNDVAFYHHESVTRGDDHVDAQRLYRNLKELEQMFAMHPDYVKRDLYYSPYLIQNKLDGSIRYEFKKTEMEILTELPFDLEDAGEEVVCHLEFFRETGWAGRMEAGGFIYDQGLKHNHLNRRYLVLKNNRRCYYVKLQDIFNSTIALRMKSGQNLNFAEFYACFSTQALEKGEYEVGILLKEKARKMAKRCMCENPGKVKILAEMDRRGAL